MRWCETRQRLELLGGSRRELERELEVVRFQAEEITAAGFVADEEEELNTRVARLRNAEQLASGSRLVSTTRSVMTVPRRAGTGSRRVGAAGPSR